MCVRRHACKQACRQTSGQHCPRDFGFGNGTCSDLHACTTHLRAYVLVYAHNGSRKVHSVRCACVMHASCMRSPTHKYTTTVRHRPAGSPPATAGWARNPFISGPRSPPIAAGFPNGPPGAGCEHDPNRGAHRETSASTASPCKNTRFANCVSQRGFAMVVLFGRCCTTARMHAPMHAFMHPASLSAAPPLLPYQAETRDSCCPPPFSG